MRERVVDHGDFVMGDGGILAVDVKLFLDDRLIVAMPLASKARGPRKPRVSTSSMSYLPFPVVSIQRPIE
jgi:hypothetical protein